MDYYNQVNHHLDTITDKLDEIRNITIPTESKVHHTIDMIERKILVLQQYADRIKREHSSLDTPSSPTQQSH